MHRFYAGECGFLHFDEKMNIHAENSKLYPLSEMVFAISDDKRNVKVLSEDFNDVKAKKAFLGVSYKFSDTKFPARINALAVVPFEFGENAHLPAIGFVFKIKNMSKKVRNYNFGVLLKNEIEDTFHKTIEHERYVGVELSSAAKLSFHGDYMTHALLTDKQACVTKYFPKRNTKELFLEQLGDGCFTDEEYCMPDVCDYAVLSKKISLQPGQTHSFCMVYAWHAPNVLLNDSDVLHDADMRRFNSSSDVCAYVMDRWESLFKTGDVLNKTVKLACDNKAVQNMYFKNVNAVYAAQIRKFEQVGTSPLFYKGKYATKNIYQSALPATVALYGAYFDCQREAEALFWSVENCVADNGIYIDFPDCNIENGISFYAAYVQLTPIFRLYQLYSLGYDTEYVCHVIGMLPRILDGLEKLGFRAENNTFFVKANNSLDEAGICLLYVLAMLCMQCMAEACSELTLAEQYGTAAAECMEYTKNTFYNGRYFTAKELISTSENPSCATAQVIPFVLAKALDIQLYSSDIVVDILNNVYILNYHSDDVNGIFGVRAYTEDVSFDVLAEQFYIQALLQYNMQHIAMLVWKAFQTRGLINENETVFAFLPTLCGLNYNYTHKCLSVHDSSTVCFAKNALIYCEAGEGCRIGLCGAPLRIDTLHLKQLDGVKSVTYKDQEMDFILQEDKIIFQSPIVLCEGEEICIKRKNRGSL